MHIVLNLVKYKLTRSVLSAGQCLHLYTELNRIWVTPVVYVPLTSSDWCRFALLLIKSYNQFMLSFIIPHTPPFIISMCSRAKDVVAAARPPVRFFSVDAPVVDLYLGQLDQVRLSNALWWLKRKNNKNKARFIKYIGSCSVGRFETNITWSKLCALDKLLNFFLQVERLRSMAEVSFIFFYAPWCAHSMAARQEVTQVAKNLAKQVWRHKPLKAGGFK